MTFLYFNIALFVLAGCGTTTNEESVADKINDSTSEEVVKDDTGNSPSEKGVPNIDDEEEAEIISNYSSEQIEYACVWLQLGVNREIDELNIRHISAGDSINPNDDTSINYPEDVIQLSGSRLADGSVTYSNNGDGTINVYNIPLRWDGNYPAGEKFYNNMIENKERIYIDPGNNDKEIIEIIKLQNFHS